MLGEDPGFAPAKVNLALHVTGRRPDGMHLLDSLVVFADIGDRVSRSSPEGGSNAVSLRVSGPFAADVPADESNLVLRAARAAGATGIFHLSKNLPAAAGLGGGSSDAAACLRLLGAKIDPLEIGADVPVCMRARASRMSGVGDVVRPAGLPPLPAVLVSPAHSPSASGRFGLRGLSTGAVFAKHDEMPAKDRGAAAGLGAIPEFGSRGEVFDWLARRRNDLEAAATALEPRIGAVLGELGARGAALARMSGSGPACFALLESDDMASECAATIAAAHPDWWVAHCRLG